MKPMLARTYGPRYNHWPCYVQPKLNGVRALYQRGAFQSRDEKLWSDRVLAHLTQSLRLYSDVLDDTILDGELYVHGWRLQRINAAVAVNRHEPTDDTPHICFHVFDVVSKRPFSERWFEIYHGLQSANLPNVFAVPTALVHDAGDMIMHFNHYTSFGYEGIMLRPDGPYEYGEHEARSGPSRMTQYRSPYLWKHKQWLDSEFRCVGVTQGEGKADIGIGALVLTTDWNGFFHGGPEGHFKVGTGFTDEERISFAQNPPIGQLIKVRYLCLTADGIPFNPSFLAVMQ